MRPLLVISAMGERRALRVARITDVWEVIDEWWRDRPVARRYFSVVLEDGAHTTLFRDLSDGGWYAQRA
jgi:hypothetical protein